MKVFVILAALANAVLANPVIQFKAPFYAANSPTAIDGEYIVVFKKEIGDDIVASHMASLHAQIINRTKVGQDMMIHEWKMGKMFRGYGAAIPEEVLEDIRGMAEVAYVERNQEMKAVESECMDQNSAEWGLVRTTLKDWPPPSGMYKYSYEKTYLPKPAIKFPCGWMATECLFKSFPVDGWPPNATVPKGEDIDAYIIDTGIDYLHPDFEGRVDQTLGVDFIDTDSDGMDFNGHGTHVTGTVLGNEWGIAKKATGIAIRVLNANGYGSNMGVIAGINHVGNASVRRGKKSVANMSLGGGISLAMNDAVNACVTMGVHMAVAAGNEGDDACTGSPASAQLVETVGATDDGDFPAIFSNFGTCVDIYAPGVDVKSAYPNGGTATLSGTSMAAPHVTGVMAMILSEGDSYDEPAKMKTHLAKIANKDKLKDVPGNTPNLLVFHDCD